MATFSQGKGLRLGPQLRRKGEVCRVRKKEWGGGVMGPRRPGQAMAGQREVRAVRAAQRVRVRGARQGGRPAAAGAREARGTKHFRAPT